MYMSHALTEDMLKTRYYYDGVLLYTIQSQNETLVSPSNKKIAHVRRRATEHNQVNDRTSMMSSPISWSFGQFESRRIIGVEISLENIIR